jgi:hypothetical protein
MNSTSHLNPETEQATSQSRKSSTSIPTLARTARRGIRAFIPSFPPRRTCLMKQMLAALREAEQAAWQASGGDFLNSMHQPVI